MSCRKVFPGFVGTARDPGVPAILFVGCQSGLTLVIHPKQGGGSDLGGCLWDIELTEKNMEDIIYCSVGG